MSSVVEHPNALSTRVHVEFYRREEAKRSEIPVLARIVLDEETPGAPLNQLRGGSELSWNRVEFQNVVVQRWLRHRRRRRLARGQWAEVSSAGVRAAKKT